MRALIVALAICFAVASAPAASAKKPAAVKHAKAKHPKARKAARHASRPRSH